MCQVQTALAIALTHALAPIPIPRIGLWAAIQSDIDLAAITKGATTYIGIKFNTNTNTNTNIRTPSLPLATRAEVMPRS